MISLKYYPFLSFCKYQFIVRFILIQSPICAYFQLLRSFHMQLVMHLLTVLSRFSIPN